MCVVDLYVVNGKRIEAAKVFDVNSEDVVEAGAMRLVT
jgi:hypothetical protein